MIKLFINKINNLIRENRPRDEGVEVLLEFLNQLGYVELVNRFKILKDKE